MNITIDELRQVTQDICDTMLGLNLAPVTDGGESQPSFITYVSINGTWNAHVEVAVCDDAAKYIASTMFDSDSPTAEEVEDAIAEVANMIGGNIKGLADCDCSLSLPQIGESPSEGFDLARLEYKLDEGNVRVDLKQQSPVNLAI